MIIEFPKVLTGTGQPDNQDHPVTQRQLYCLRLAIEKLTRKLEFLEKDQEKTIRGLQI